MRTTAQQLEHPPDVLVIRVARRGMWINGTNIESPADYKRRHAGLSIASQGEPYAEEAPDVQDDGFDEGRLSWFSRLWKRS